MIKHGIVREYIWTNLMLWALTLWFNRTPENHSFYKLMGIVDVSFPKAAVIVEYNRWRKHKKASLHLTCGQKLTQALVVRHKRSYTEILCPWEEDTPIRLFYSSQNTTFSLVFNPTERAETEKRSIEEMPTPDKKKKIRPQRPTQKQS